MPLMGVGLMYREGYFRQYLNVDGWEQNAIPKTASSICRLIPEQTADGSQLTIGVPFRT